MAEVNASRIFRDMMAYLYQIRSIEPEPTVYMSNQLFFLLCEDAYTEPEIRMLPKKRLTIFGHKCRTIKEWSGLKYVIGFERNYEEEFE